MTGTAEKYCVLGAGSSGLVAAKNLRAHGFDVDVLERQADLGGNWNYDLPCGHVYRSTHMISSKAFTQFPDFPMPREFPEYPHHTQVLAYLRAYADEFKLREAIEFGAGVARIEPVDGGAGWQVTLESGQSRRYAGVAIANGHHWSPRWPSYPGEFTGQVLHSAQYKTPDVLAGRRVLVVGGGNSGCDIAVEAAQHGAVAFHSTRRGYHYIPKFFFGLPSDRAGDVLLALGVPLWIRRRIIAVLLRIAVGPAHRTGLPRPDHRLFESHPIVNSLLPYYVGQGDIRVKPDVARLDGQRVHFADGSVETIDTIVYATGYNVDFPFLERGLLDWRDGRPALFMHAYHPRHDGLMVAGMIQPDSGIFSLVHWQTEAWARFLRAARSQSPAADWFRRQRAQPDGGLRRRIRYTDSPRHSLEVEHWSYMQALKKLMRRLGD
jgi:cation diffusion facilitator CzcD-associated flavoprotein CzcO